MREPVKTDPPKSTGTQGAASTPRYVTDKVMAALIGVSPSFLQKDRISARLIPVVRVGDKCLYHPPAVFAALEATPAKRGRRA